MQGPGEVPAVVAGVSEVSGLSLSLSLYFGPLRSCFPLKGEDAPSPEPPPPHYSPSSCSASPGDRPHMQGVVARLEELLQEVQGGGAGNEEEDYDLEDFLEDLCRGGMQ